MLKLWHPQKEAIDELLACPSEEHATEVDDAYALYVAFQKSVHDPTKDDGSQLTPRTFEDALIYENYSALRDKTGNAASRKIVELIGSELSGADLESALFDLLKSTEKASFAIDCLVSFEDETALKPPPYIAKGLTWLEDQLEEPRSFTDEGEGLSDG